MGAAGVAVALIQVQERGYAPILSTLLPVIITIFVLLVGVVYHNMRKAAEDNRELISKLFDRVEVLNTNLTKVETAVLGLGPTGDGGILLEVKKLREERHSILNEIQGMKMTVKTLTPP